MKKSRIMWIECKADGLVGPARIGRVTWSKSGRSLYYGGKRFESLSGQGFKANYFEVESGDEYWISGCRKDGRDALYNTDVEIDEDVREEYWTNVRESPEKVGVASFRAIGKCK
ncbi:MAG: 1-deoxy-D-xylulose-5-phosphate synthase [Planctomycetes bacterium]|nr:1-deoxy-D-xylulose-5-phosphate synthase [Planctomycetota bacterium]